MREPGAGWLTFQNGQPIASLPARTAYAGTCPSRT